MLTKQQKENAVAELHERLPTTAALIAVDYRGLTVEEASELRGKLRTVGEGNIEYRVAKNTLVRRAIAGTRVEPLSDFLTGPTALALAFDEPSALAKTLVDYAKDHEVFEIKGGVIDGEFADVAMIGRLAELPSKDELRGMLAGTLQAPLRNLAGTLNSLLGNVRNALEQRQQQLEGE